MTAKQKSILLRIAKIQKQIDKIKSLYQERDDLLFELNRTRFKQSDDYKLIDRFKTKDKLFTTTSISRFELIKK